MADSRLLPVEPRVARACRTCSPNRTLVAAQHRARRQPRSGGAAAAGLPRDHPRVPYRRGRDRAARRRGQYLVRPRPVHVRAADALSSRAARCSAIGGLIFGGGFAAQALAPALRRLSPRPTSCRASAARRSIRSATACSPSSFPSTAAASPSPRTSPAATSARSPCRCSARG